MQKLSLPALALFVLCAAGCDWDRIRGNGHIVTEQRPIDEFTELNTRGGFDIEWRSGPPALSVTTDENLLSYIETQKIDNRLEVRTRERVWPRHGIKVVVSSSARSGAKLSGASDLKVPALTGPRFAVQSSGAADVVLDGAVDELFADMTGASDLTAKNLHVRKAEVSITGAGDAVVNVSEVLRAAITGAGDVAYFGNPPTIEKRIAGAGSIRHKE